MRTIHTTFFVLAAAGSMFATNLIAAAIPATNQDSHVTKIENVNPFTHSAQILAGADLSSIHFAGVKRVKVAAQVRSTMNESYCREAAGRDPGGSMYCPYTRPESFVLAYELTYTFTGQPLPTDEFASRNFSFSVLLRPDELAPATLKALSARNIDKAEAQTFFHVSTDRPAEARRIVDETASKYCDGSFIEGLWTRTDSKCSDEVIYKTVTVPADLITVTVDPVAGSRPVVASLR